MVFSINIADKLSSIVKKVLVKFEAPKITYKPAIRHTNIAPWKTFKGNILSMQRPVIKFLWDIKQTKVFQSVQ